MPEFVDTLVIWLDTLAVILVAGVPLFGLLVVRPASSAAKDPEAITAPLRRLLIGGTGLSVLSAALAGLAQAAPIPARIDPALMGVLLGQYASTLGGGLIELRLGLILLLALVAGSLPPPGKGRAGPWWGAALLGLAILISVSLQRYAPALDPPLPAAVDAARLVGSSLWLGGLTGLAAVLAAKAHRGSEVRLAVFRALAARTSLWALIGVDLLALAGLAAALGGVAELTGVEDRRADAIRFALTLSGLGALHLLVALPRIIRKGAAPLRADLFTGALVVIVAGLLTPIPRLTLMPGLAVLAPPVRIPDARQLDGFVGYDSAGDTGVVLRISPAKAGVTNQVWIDVFDRRGKTAPAQVELHFRMATDRSGGVTVQAAPAGEERFTARGSYLAFEGDWLAEATVRRSGHADVVHRFVVPVSVDPGLSGICGHIVEPAIPNPVPADEESIAAGKALYAENCAPCHGASGRGDGPVGITLSPRPADLTKHAMAGVHTDGRLYLWITDGYSDSVMPAFKDYLTDDERWSIVNYIRTFAEPPQAGP